MSTEKEIRQRGMEVLLKELGDLDTEKFIKMLIREPFDYTEWQRSLWSTTDIDELDRKAQMHQKKSDG